MTADVPTIGAEDGDDMTMVPKYNFYAALNQDFELLGRDANIRFDANGYGKYKTHFDVRPEDISPAYVVFNLSAGMQINDSARIDVHVKNLRNERILRYRNSRSRDTSSYWAIHEEYYAPDRTVAVRLDFTF